MPDRRKTVTRTGARRPQPQQSYGPSLSRMKQKMGSKSKVIFVILLGSIVVGVLLMFSGTGSGPMAGGGAEQSADTVAVKVAGQQITLTDIEHAATQAQQSMYGPPRNSIADMPENYAQAVKELIKQKVELKAAQDSGIHVSDAEYSKMLNDMIDQALKQQQSQFEPGAWDKYLKNSGKTMADVREGIQTEYENRARQQGLELHDVLIEELTLKDFRGQYEEKQDLGRFLRYSQIVAPVTQPRPQPGATTPPPVDPAQDAAAKAKAGDLFKQLKSGSDFAKLADANAPKPQTIPGQPAPKPNGGDQGWINPTQPGSPAYLKDAGSAKVGDLLGPFKSFDGYHIIKITGETHKLPPNLDKAPQDEQQADWALSMAANQLYDKYLDGLVAKAKVIYKDPIIAGTVAQSKHDPAYDKVALSEYEKGLKAKTPPPSQEAALAAYAVGQMLMAQNNPGEAATYLTRATNAQSTSSEAWLALGDAEKKLQNKDQALADYRKALVYGPGNAMVLGQLVEDFKELKSQDDADRASQKLQEAQAQGGSNPFGGMSGLPQGLTVSGAGAGGTTKTITVKTPPSGVKTTPITIKTPPIAVKTSPSGVKTTPITTKTAPKP